jgi:hypothetical protein
MANAISAIQLKTLPKEKYDTVRSNLKTGDIVFCSGGYVFSKIIQGLTKSTWSHCGVIYKDENLGRILILEAEPFVGIRLIPLSKYLTDYKGKRKPYKGKIVVASITETAAPQNINKGISFGLDELTRPYDNWEIFRIALRILFKAGKRERNRAYICSELVREVYRKAGLHMQLQDTYISPDNIWNNKNVVIKHRLL